MPSQLELQWSCGNKTGWCNKQENTYIRIVIERDYRNPVINSWPCSALYGLKRRSVSYHGPLWEVGVFKQKVAPYCTLTLETSPHQPKVHFDTTLCDRLDSEKVWGWSLSTTSLHIWSLPVPLSTNVVASHGGTYASRGKAAGVALCCRRSRGMERIQRRLHSTVNNWMCIHMYSAPCWKEMDVQTLCPWQLSRRDLDLKGFSENTICWHWLFCFGPDVRR